MSRMSTSAPTTGASQSHGGSFSSRASFAYGKLDTMAKASSATPATMTRPGTGTPMATVRASTAAAMVVGTPQKKRPSFGETLNRASRTAAHAATSAQETAAAAGGAEPASEA